MDADDALGRLIGGHLDTVSFVMDYVEFGIGYNVLRALNPPESPFTTARLQRSPVRVPATRCASSSTQTSPTHSS